MGGRLRYDFVFFGFWLSHVPLDRFEVFWSMVADSLAPAGRVFFVDDNARTPEELIEGDSSTRLLALCQEAFLICPRYIPAPTSDQGRAISVLLAVIVLLLFGPIHLSRTPATELPVERTA